MVADTGDGSGAGPRFGEWLIAGCGARNGLSGDFGKMRSGLEREAVAVDDNGAHRASIFVYKSGYHTGAGSSLEQTGGQPVMNELRQEHERNPMIQFIDHIKNCLTVRRLLKERTAPNVNELYWYDMRLVDAVGWQGILKVLLHQMFDWQQDEIAGNYDLVNLYYARPMGDGLNESGASVWNCRDLDSKPWFDEPNPVKEILELNADIIITEYQNVANRIATHPDNASLTDRGRWTGMFLYAANGVRNEELCQLCPQTISIIESLPLCTNFGFVMFSGLEPHTHIQPHSGSSNLRLRHHLGIDVPEPDKAKIRVGTQWRGWAKGKSIAFDDSFEHEVVHEGDQDRVVLVVDVWHPSLTARDIEMLSHPVFQRFGKRQRDGTDQGRKPAITKASF